MLFHPVGMMHSGKFIFPVDLNFSWQTVCIFSVCEVIICHNLLILDNSCFNFYRNKFWWFCEIFCIRCENIIRERIYILICAIISAYRHRGRINMFRGVIFRSIYIRCDFHCFQYNIAAEATSLYKTAVFIARSRAYCSLSSDKIISVNSDK